MIFAVLQEKIEQLGHLYVEFETMQRELVIWIDNAEDVLSDLDRIKADVEPSEEDINKFKVSLFFFKINNLKKLLCYYPYLLT